MLGNATSKNQLEMLVVEKTHFHSSPVTQTVLKQKEPKVCSKQNVQQLACPDVFRQLCSHGTHELFFKSAPSSAHAPGNYHLT